MATITKKQLMDEVELLRRRVAELEEAEAESKQVEKALRESETNFQALFQNINSGVAIYEEVEDGKDFVYKDLNWTGEHIDRVNRDEIIDKKVTEAFPGVKDFGLLDVLQRVWRTGDPESLPVSFYKDERISGWRDNYVYRLPSGDVVAVYDDITVSKQTEETLRESETRFKTIFENVNDEIIYINESGIIVNVNGRVEDILGYKRDEVIGRNFTEFEFVGSEGLQYLTQQFLRALNGETVPLRTFNAKRKDGGIVAVELSSRLVHLDNGEKGILAIIRNVTEREQAVQKLKENEENYTAVVEQANDGVVVVQEGLYVYVNEAWARTTGYSRDELMAMTIEDIVIPEHKTIVRERYELRMKGGTPPPVYDIRIQMKNGTIRDIEVSASIIRYHGKPANMAVARDITERRQAEDALRESEEKFSKAFHSKAYLMALSTIEDGTYIDVNDGFVEMTGYTREEVIGRTATSLNIFDNPEMRSIVIQSVNENGYARDLEITIRIKNGDLRHGLFSAELISIKGTPCLLTIMSDVTERELAVDALRESEERYAAITRNLPNGLVHIIDSEFRYVFTDGQDMYRLGLSNEYLAGKSIHDVLPADIAPMVEANYKKVLQGESVTFEGDFGGSSFMVNAVPLRDADGEINQILALSTNITKRKQAEKALKESEEKYRGLIEGLNEAVYRMSLPDGNYDYFSPSVKDVFGWNTEDFLEKPSFIAEIIHPDFQSYFQEKWTDLIKGVVDPTYEYKIIGPENKERWIIQSNKGIYDNSGNIIAIEGICRDITEQKRMEDELRESEERYQRLVDQNPVAIAVHSEGKIVYMNAVGLQIIGADNEQEVVGKSVLDFIHPDHRESVIKRMRLIQESLTRAEPDEEKFIQLDGKIVDTEVTGIPVTYMGKPAIQVVFWDITDRKKAEFEVRDWKNRYEAAILASGHILYDWDTDKNEVTYGGGIEKILGYSTGEMNGGLNRWMELIHPEDRAQFDEAIANLLKTGEAAHIHYRVRRKDGEYIVVEDEGYFVLDVKGNPSRMIGFVKDITERKQAEEKLRQSEERYRSLVENINDVIFSVDASGAVTYMSPAMERITSYCIDEIIGRSFTEFIHPDDVAAVLSSFEITLEGTIEPLEFRIVDKDGTIRYVRSSSRPVTENNIVLGVTGVLTDITERKRSEEKLRAQDRRFRTLIEKSSDVIGVLDVQGTIQYVSPSIEQVLGYTPEEILGLRFFDLLDPEDHAMLVSVMKRLMEKPEATIVQQGRFRNSNGLWNIMEGTLCNLLHDETIGGIVVNARDVTKRKQAEEALKGSEEKFRLITENMLDAISLLDENGILRYVSPSHETILGYKPEELLGKRALEFVYPEDQDEVRSVLDSVSEGKDTGQVQYEYRFRHSLGHYVWAESLGKAIFDHKGRLVTYIIGTRDITERKQIENAIRESEEKFRNVVEQSIDGIALIDEKGCIVEWNPGLEKITGINRDQAVGEFLWELQVAVLPDELMMLETDSVIESGIQTFLETGETPTGKQLAELTIQKPDGRTSFVQMSVFPIKTDKGFRGACIMRDMTLYKETEDALRHSEEGLAKAQQIAHMGSWEWNLADDSFTMSDEMCRIYAIDDGSQFTTFQSHLDKAIHPEDKEEIIRSAGEISTSGIGPTVIYRIIRPGGEVRWVETVSPQVKCWAEGGSPLVIVGTIQDITERKQAEERIQRQSEFLNSLIESLNHPFYVLDVNDYKIIMANRAAAVPGDIADAVTCHALAHGSEKPCADLKNHPCPVDEIRITKKPVMVEHTHVDKYGNERIVEVRAHPLLDEEQHVIQVIEYCLDVTERKQAEDALAIIRERLELAMDASEHGFWDWNLDTDDVYFSPRYYTMLGYEPGELPMRLETWIDLLHPEDRETIVPRIQKYVRDAEPYEVDFRLRTKDGGFRWISGRGKTFKKDADSKPHRAVGVHVDITERKQAEEALRESESSLLQAQAIAHLGRFRLDLNTNIIYASEEMMNIYGFAPDLSGKLTVETWQPFVHPDDLDSVTTALGNTATVGDPYNIEFRIYRTDGEMRIMHAQGELVRDPSGIPVSIVGTGLDITERKQAEEKIHRLNEELEQRVIERTYQLEAANKELEAFTYSVSHDLRAPLRHVSSFAEILEEEYRDSLPEDALENVTAIIESATKMNMLIDGLLGLSRMDRQELNIKLIKLKGVVEDARKELEPEIEGRKVKWKIGKLPTIEGDPVLIKALVTNLLSNAIKFTSRSDKAVIEVESLPGGSPGFLVRDNGVGFNMKYSNKLFGVFQRLHSQSDFEGTGIGLATVQRIITRHNGRIWAEGEVDRGSTFYVEFESAKLRKERKWK